MFTIRINSNIQKTTGKWFFVYSLELICAIIGGIEYYVDTLLKRTRRLNEI